MSSRSNDDDDDTYREYYGDNTESDSESTDEDSCTDSDCDDHRNECVCKTLVPYKTRKFSINKCKSMRIIKATYLCEKHLRKLCVYASEHHMLWVFSAIEEKQSPATEWSILSDPHWRQHVKEFSKIDKHCLELVASGNDGNLSILHHLCAADKQAEGHTLFEYICSAHPDMVFFGATYTDCGTTPLEYAARQCHLLYIDILLQHGADLHHPRCPLNGEGVFKKSMSRGAVIHLVKRGLSHFLPLTINTWGGSKNPLSADYALVALGVKGNGIYVHVDDEGREAIRFEAYFAHSLLDRLMFELSRKRHSIDH